MSNNPNATVIVCDECDGDGWVWETYPCGDECCGSFERDCPECRGTGELEVVPDGER